MDQSHIMQLDQQHNLEEQCNQEAAMARTSTSVSVSQVAFTLAAVAFLSLFSSFAMAMRASSFPSAAALSAHQLFAALCSFATTKKALFLLSNVIFLFLAADCRCFFGICSMSPSTSNDVAVSELAPSCVLAKQAGHHQEEMEICAVQPCISYSGSLHHSSSSNIPSENCSEEQGKREQVPVSSQPELFRLEEEEEEGENGVTLETVVFQEPTCGTADQELEKLEIDELNRKFEEFIRSRRIKWIKEEEEALQCRQV